MLNGWRPYFWIITAGTLLYSAVAFFGFTYLDDNFLILKNQELLSSLTNIPKAFQQDLFHMIHEKAVLYRPVLVSTFIVDAQLTGHSATAYHLTNILIHLAASCSLFLLLATMRWSKGVCLIFSLIFCVHPALTSAVAWIPGRNDSLMSLFTILSFTFFLRYLRNRGAASLILHIGLLALSLLSKEPALMLIPLCVLYILLREAEPLELNGKLILGASWLVVISGWFVLRALALSHNPVFPDASLFLRYMMNGAPAILIYLGKVLFPFNLSVVPNIKDSGILYGIAALLAIAVAIFFTKERKYRRLLFGAAWFLAFLIPTFLQSRPEKTPLFLECRLYLPIIGIFIILLDTDFIKKLQGSKRGAMITAACTIIAFSILTWQYTSVFRDRHSFWDAAVKQSPNSPLAHVNLGVILLQDEQYDKAEEELRHALRLNPKQRSAHLNLGIIYNARKQYHQAIEEFLQEIEIRPDYDASYMHLAYTYYVQKDIKKAMEYWQSALKCNPNNSKAREFIEAFGNK
ncbi:hypothetical protein BVX97_04460 [bacterium E08(2017)]|nr:hypothetical protein BVX97_04460 [bacterium E08(2017)]